MRLPIFYKKKRKIMEKIRIKYLPYDGSTIKSKVVSIDMPKFKDEKTTSQGIFLNISKESKIMDFLDNMDKTEIMEKHERVPKNWKKMIGLLDVDMTMDEI